MCVIEWEHPGLCFQAIALAKISKMFPKQTLLPDWAIYLD